MRAGGPVRYLECETSISSSFAESITLKCPQHIGRLAGSELRYLARIATLLLCHSVQRRMICEEASQNRKVLRLRQLRDLGFQLFVHRRVTGYTRRFSGTRARKQ